MAFIWEIMLVILQQINDETNMFFNQFYVGYIKFMINV